MMRPIMLNPRLDDLTDYPFQRLRALLDDIPPGGEPVIMSIGEPKLSPPAFIDEIIAKNRHLWGNYPPPAGTPAFRDAVLGWLNRRYGLNNLVSEADILPVAGTREALYMIGQLAVPPRKHGPKPAVLFPNPFYQVYVGAAVMAGADAVPITANQDNGFQPDYEALDEALLARTCVAFVCSPANPQGSVASLDRLKRLITLARTHDFILACDECYSEIYDQEPPPGALQACAAMGGDTSNVVVFNSLSKRSSAPGLRSGFVTGDPALIKAFARLRSYGGASVPGPILAASAALWSDEAHVKESLELYRSNMDLAEEILGRRFGFARPKGSFFLWLNVGDGEAAARKLWQEAGLRVLPGAYLARDDGTGDNGAKDNPGRAYIRVALVHDRTTTKKALEKLNAVLTED